MSIDYGMGSTNIDKVTGIHYGVISLNSIDFEALDSEQELIYGEPSCPKCALVLAPDSEADDMFYCSTCNDYYATDRCYPEEPNGWRVVNDEYAIHPCLDNDAIIIKSPYYTYCEYCSPCVPGAGNLGSVKTWEDVNKGVACKAYCLGADWFEDGKAPYPIYSVELEN